MPSDDFDTLHDELMKLAKDDHDAFIKSVSQLGRAANRLLAAKQRRRHRRTLWPPHTDLRTFKRSK